MLDGIPIGTLTAPALVGIAILFIFTGRLVTRATWLDKEKEAERWRQAYEIERTAHAAADAQTAQLLEFAKTNHALITAVFENSRRIRQSGDPDVASDS